MSLRGQFLELFYPEVDFSTIASREPIQFKVDVQVSDPTEKEYHYVGFLSSPRGVLNEINLKTANGPACFKKLTMGACVPVTDELLRKGPWVCHACRNRASLFTFNFMSYLHEQPTPYIIDHMCRSVCVKPQCHVQTERWCQNTFRLAYRSHATKQQRDAMKQTNLNRRNCACCSKQEDKSTGIRLSSCARCRHVRYCSKECQREDWSDHKVSFHGLLHIQCLPTVMLHP